MAIIGQHSDLYTKVVSEGSKFRELKYSDVSDTEPLVSSGLPKVTSGKTNPVAVSEVTSKVTARIDDSKRIAKLLTKYQGIKWEAHNVELASIQQQLAEKRGQYAGGDNNRDFRSNLWEGLQTAAITLAQTAVAGTGEHFSAWQNNTYLKNGGAAAEVLATGLVTIHADDPVEYYQLPNSDASTATIEEAQKPGEFKSKIENGQDPRTRYTRGGTWNPNNRYGSGSTTENVDFSLDLQQPLVMGSEADASTMYTITRGAPTYEQVVTENKRYSRFGGAGSPYKTKGEGENTAQEAQKPGYGKDPKVKDVLGRGERAASYRIDAVSWNRNFYREETDETYIDELNSKFENSANLLSKINYDKSRRPGDDIGPWMPEGTHALLAARTENNGKGTSDGNYNADGGGSNFTGPMAPGADTRVDNGRIEMIPFWIRAITPYGDPLFDDGYLFFEANLDSYTDNYDASWQGTQYVGRADKFWTYTGFDRQINFAFKMVAHSKSHLKPLYNRLNGLLSMTAPNYGDGTFMRGTLAEITIGDLLSRQLGFIRNVGLKWETDYMWETDAGTIRVPHVLDVSVGFTPIHRFVPETRKRYFELANAGQGGSSKGSLGEKPFGLFTANAPVGENGSSGYKIYDFQK